MQRQGGKNLQGPLVGELSQYQTLESHSTRLPSQQFNRAPKLYIRILASNFTGGGLFHPILSNLKLANRGQSVIFHYGPDHTTSTEDLNFQFHC